MSNTQAVAGTSVGVPHLWKSYETSGANAALTVSSPTDASRVRRLVAVFVRFSSSVSKTVTLTYNSAEGAAYDCDFATITLTSAASGCYLPTAEIKIAPGDAIDATSQAGGGGITCAITLITEPC